MDFLAVIDDLKRGVLDLDCKEMELCRNKAGGARFVGKGYIRQSKEGVLYFKMYVVRTENVNPLRQLLERAPYGNLYTDDMFYTLTAVGYDGTNWKADQILPSPRWDMGDGSVVVSGQMETLLSRSSYASGQHYLRLHFFEELEIPLNRMTETDRHGERIMVRDRVKFEALSMKFEVRVWKTDTIIEVFSQDAMLANICLRIQESLQYITARTASWRARVEFDKKEFCLELVSPVAKSTNTFLKPPLSHGSIDYQQNGWKLFSHFLTYVVRETKDTYWNPVAYHLHNARESSANSIDARAVGCSVAVEALAGLAPFRQDAQTEKTVAAFQSEIKKVLLEPNVSRDMKSRIKGWIDSLSEVRVPDRLHALAVKGHVEREYIRAWIRLRNRHVHPKISDLKKPTPWDSQQLIDLIRKVEVLLNQLTFYLIGYAGPFTDYGSSDTLASKPYPLKPAVMNPLLSAEQDTKN